MILQIASPHVKQVWDGFAKDWLVPAMERHWFDFEPDRVEQDIRSGKMQLWVIPDKAAFVSQIEECPNKKVCTVILGGGRDAREWIRSFADHMTQWSQSMGCDELRIVGRRGWKHYLEDATELGTIFAKRLNHDHSH